MSEKGRKARIPWHRRVRATISGPPERPRLNVFRSLGQIYAQVIDDVAGHTVASDSTVDRELRGVVEGETETGAAKMVGRLVANRAQAAGVKQVVFDRGGYRYHGRVKALADGAREAGLEF